MRIEAAISLFGSIALHAGAILLAGNMLGRQPLAAPLLAAAGNDVVTLELVAPTSENQNEIEAAESSSDESIEETEELPALPPNDRKEPVIDTPSDKPVISQNEIRPTHVESTPQHPTLKQLPPAPSRARGITKSGSSAAQSGRAGEAKIAPTSAQYRFRAPLHYPATALRKNIGGRIILSIAINENGNATDVQVKLSSGNSALDDAAISCARASRYEPPRVNGLPQSCQVDAPFDFKPCRK